MFNAEKLLGKVMREVAGSGHGKKKKKRKHGNALINSLKSGTGLMTAIGLEIGAYEILRSKSQPRATGQPDLPPTPPMPGGSPQPAQQHIPPPIPPSAPLAAPSPSSGHITTEDLARRMIQLMIAAAHADGTMDEQEEQAVLERLKSESLSQEEKMFLLTELHNPKSIVELTEGITDPSASKAMYMLAVRAVDIDTEAERRWFDELAARLGLSQAVQAFIEEQS